MVDVRLALTDPQPYVEGKFDFMTELAAQNGGRFVPTK